MGRPGTATIPQPVIARRQGMPCWSNSHHYPCHHHWLYWDTPEPFLHSPWRSASLPREAYIRRLEDERDLLAQCLQRLEQEVQELRKNAHTTLAPTGMNSRYYEARRIPLRSEEKKNKAIGKIKALFGVHALQRSTP